MLRQKSPETDPEDGRIIELSLQTKASAATREAYTRNVANFKNWDDKTLRNLQLDELLAYLGVIVCEPKQLCVLQLSDARFAGRARAMITHFGMSHA